MNIALAAVLVVLAAAALSVTGFVLTSRYIPQRWRVARADGASTVHATIGMIYAILIAEDEGGLPHPPVGPMGRAGTGRPQGTR